jgi:hypothetical protein
VSLHLPHDLSSLEDIYVESDAAHNTSDSEDNHTLTAFGDASVIEEKILN